MSAKPPRSAEAPLMAGRAGESHTLLDAVVHPPSVALVEGEAGIGKSRLIREALRHPSVRNRRVLLGRCRPLREPFPYGPVLDLLRHVAGTLPTSLNPVCGALRPYLPELAEALPPAPEALPEALGSRHQLFRAVRALLASLGETVMVIEDLHWADEGTRDLVRFLVDDPPQGLSVVLSYRREELPGSGLPLGRAYRHPPGTTAVLIPLEALDVHAVRSVFAAVTGAPQVPAGFAAELRRRTAGIPFVVEEVIRTLPERVRVEMSHDPAEWDAMAVPTLVREAVADRMGELSHAAAQAVAAASVLREPAREQLIASVTNTLDLQGQCTDGTGRRRGGEDAPSCADAVREALRAGLLHECGDQRYGFRHALAQQAVYEELPGPDRRQLHHRALRALADQDPPALTQLAYHARQVGDLAQWQRYAERAAGAARGRGELPLAVGLLEELLRGARLPRPERARIAVQLSQDAVAGSTHHRVTELLAHVVSDSHLPDGVRGEIRLNLSLLLHNQAGAYEAGRAEAELAVEELRHRPVLAARGMAALAMPGWGDHAHHVYQGWIERAQRLTVNEPRSSAVRTAVWGNALALRVFAGDASVWAETDALLEGAATGLHRRELARAWGNLADAATGTGHYAAAHRFRTEGLRLAAACGATYLEGVLQGTALRLDWYEGRWQELGKRARHSLEAVRGVSVIAADAQLVLGLLGCAVGDWEEAAAHLRAAGITDPGNAMEPVLASASGAMARLHVARGDLAAGRDETLRALARVRRKEMWVWAGGLLPEAVAVLVRCGEVAHADAVTAQFAAGLTGRDAPLAAAALLACRGVVALGEDRTTAAARAFDAAGVAYQELPQPYSAARAREAALRCRLAGAGAPGDVSGSHTELVLLEEEFTRLGATRDAARCRRVLRGTGSSLPSRRGRRGYGAQLSPRERDVARLVARGHTNREIADVLFLSPRTVEQHVAKVLRKLGVRSRAEVTDPELPRGQRRMG